MGLGANDGSDNRKWFIAIGASATMWFLYSQLFPSSDLQRLSPTVSSSGDLPVRCSDQALVKREDAHRHGVMLRDRLVAKWAPGGSADAWDSQVPLDTAAAWNAPTIWDIWAPTYGCSVPLHVGGLGSSQWGTALPLESKAICNPTQMRYEDSCVIYSFGVGWDATFEISMLDTAPNCKVRVFDPTTNAEKFWELVAKQTPDGQVAPKPPQLDFVPLGLAAETSDNYRIGSLWNNQESIRVSTLADIMRTQGDTHLTVLKVDIEGSEWTALPQAVDTGTMARVDQLLLEVHLGGCEAGYKDNNRAKLNNMFEVLEKSGLRAISNIPNLVPVSKGQYPGCAEYTFVNKDGPFVTKSCTSN